MSASAPVYTCHDTPETVARIEGDLASIVRVLRAGDPALRAVVLTGSFARGEGATRGGVAQNDFDIVALRRPWQSAAAYPAMQAQLTRRLGIEVDVAPVGAWRLPFVAHSIFWYETAVTGRVLWGEELLHRIPVRRAMQIDGREALRLLVNRAAGLLLFARAAPDMVRLQAAKAILAAADAQLLAVAPARFAPRQTERRPMWAGAIRVAAKAGRWPSLDWVEWAWSWKTDPERAAERNPDAAWAAAREAILAAVPAALKRARLPTIEAYARADRIAERLIYVRRASAVPAARRWVLHPAGRIRVATLRLLQAAPDGCVQEDEAARILRPVARAAKDPIALLGQLRAAAPQ